MTSARKVMKLGLGFPEKVEVDDEHGNTTGHTIFRLGNQGLPDNGPNWDHRDRGEGSGRQRLTRYIIMILNRIQEAEKKPSKWNKIKEID